MNDEKENMINGIRGAVTTLAAVAVAAWITAQGDASSWCKVAGMILMFVFMKWALLDTWDYIGCRIRGRR